MMKQLGWSSFLLLAVIWSSCSKFEKLDRIADPEWSPEVALALVNTKTNLQDILSQFETGGFIRIDNDGFLTLVYEGNIASVTGDEVTTIPDFTAPIIDTVTTINYGFSANNFIDQIRCKRGRIEYTFVSPYPDIVSVRLIFSTATDASGQVLEETFQVGANGTQTGVIDLDDVTFDFSNNNFTVRYVALRSNGQRVRLGTGSIAFRGVDYRYIEGYIGNYSFALPRDTIVLDIFKNWSKGSIFFEEPSVEVLVKNSFGLPIRLGVNPLYAETHKNGRVALNNTQLANGIDFAYPGLNEVGTFKTTTLTVDYNNSNLSTLLSGIPYEVVYGGSAETNPDNDTSIKGFLLDTSRFDVDIRVELPMYGRASGFTIQDTFDLDWSIYEEFDYANFKLITENGFPVEGDLQLYFATATGQIIDSLILDPTQRVLQAAPVNANGRVTEAAIETIFVDVPQARYQSLLNQATQLILRAGLETTNDGQTSIRIYEDYDLGIKLGVKSKVDIQ